MIDPELQHYLSGINQSLTEIKNKKSPGIWRAFFNGIFGALGYVVGVAVVIVILGWFLNKLGVLPEFQKQVSDFQSLISSAQKLINVGQNEQGAQVNIKQEGDTLILPDGRKVQIVQ